MCTVLKAFWLVRGLILLGYSYKSLVSTLLGNLQERKVLLMKIIGKRRQIACTKEPTDRLLTQRAGTPGFQISTAVPLSSVETSLEIRSTSTKTLCRKRNALHLPAFEFPKSELCCLIWMMMMIVTTLFVALSDKSQPGSWVRIPLSSTQEKHCFSLQNLVFITYLLHHRVSLWIGTTTHFTEQSGLVSFCTFAGRGVYSNTE